MIATRARITTPPTASQIASWRAGPVMCAVGTSMTTAQVEFRPGSGAGVTRRSTLPAGWSRPLSSTDLPLDIASFNSATPVSA